MGNTVLESTRLGSTQKRIRYCVSGTYICLTSIAVVHVNDQLVINCTTAARHV